MRTAAGPAQRATPDPRASRAPDADAVQTARPFTPREAEAVVTTGAGTFRLDPDPAGDFPAVVAGPFSTAEVRVVYAEREGPETVVLQAEDGGMFPGAGIVSTVRLDERATVRFAFVTGPQAGHHRVSVRRGADLKGFDFWVERGDETESQRAPDAAGVR
jgi:hypothetical protein